MMSIIGKIKGLFFGEKDGLLEQDPVRSVQAQSSNVGDSKPKFSEGDILAVQRRAETIQRAFNSSLNSANLSKSRKAREHELQCAREGLVELKKLAREFPFLQLKNLKEVEASIIAVEAETSALPYDGQDLKQISSSDERVALMCIQSCFRVVNESIEIARKSNNLETKLSRLGVARNSLKEARKQASQFSLEVDGFDKAEAEINRIDEAMKAGTPTEIAGMPQIDAAYTSAARNLLMKATELKRGKKYQEACEKLREAYLAEGAENLFIEERLRLPMYLQLAGKNDEGWDELNSLYASYDQSFRPRIEHQMKIFLRKEKNESATNPVRVISQCNSSALPSSVNAAQTKPIITTADESLSNSLGRWKSNQDIYDGLRFSATMQLRTPLRVLLWHGKSHTDKNTEPPKIAIEMWEGMWLPKLRTFRELGVDIDEPPSTMASHIGPICPQEYLPFLIAVREIVERPESIECRSQLLRAKLKDEPYRMYVDKHGGIEEIMDYFFPRFVDTIPAIASAAISELSRLGLDTPNRIAIATDETLLGIKGIGQAKLKAIRDYCAQIADNRDDIRVERSLTM